MAAEGSCEGLAIGGNRGKSLNQRNCTKRLLCGVTIQVSAFGGCPRKLHPKRDLSIHRPSHTGALQRDVDSWIVGVCRIINKAERRFFGDSPRQATCNPAFGVSQRAHLIGNVQRYESNTRRKISVLQNDGRDADLHKTNLERSRCPEDSTPSKDVFYEFLKSKIAASITDVTNRDNDIYAK